MFYRLYCLNVWPLNSQQQHREIKEKKSSCTLFTVWCPLIPWKHLIIGSDIFQSFEETLWPERSRGSRGVKQKGSRRWEGREKVVINEETKDVAGGRKGGETEPEGVRQRQWVMIWCISADIFFSALVNWLRNILINIRTTEAAPCKRQIIPGEISLWDDSFLSGKALLMRVGSSPADIF